MLLNFALVLQFAAITTFYGSTALFSLYWKEYESKKDYRQLVGTLFRK